MTEFVDVNYTVCRGPGKSGFGCAENTGHAIALSIDTGELVVVWGTADSRIGMPTVQWRISTVSLDECHPAGGCEHCARLGERLRS